MTEQRHAVPLRRLDGFGLTDLTAVKLDAEGAEYEVLRGARETLLRCRPILSVEIEERHRPGSTWAVPAYLDALGYDAFWEFWGEWRPMAGFDRVAMQRASPNPSIAPGILMSLKTTSTCAPVSIIDPASINLNES